MALDQYTPLDVKHATVPIPFGSTAPSAANVTSMIAGVADRTEYALLRGVYVASAISYGQCTAGGGSIVGVTSGTGWQDFTDASGVVSYAQINSCAVDDVIEVFFAGGCAAETQTALLRLRAVQDYGGTAVDTAVNGAISKVRTYVAMGNDAERIVLAGSFVVSTAGSVRVKLQGNISASSATKVGILGGAASDGEYYSLRIVRHRPTV